MSHKTTLTITNLKQCTKCRDFKDPMAFSKNKKAKDGLNYACRYCSNLKKNKSSKKVSQ